MVVEGAIRRYGTVFSSLPARADNSGEASLAGKRCAGAINFQAGKGQVLDGSLVINQKLIARILLMFKRHTMVGGGTCVGH